MSDNPVEFLDKNYPECLLEMGRLFHTNINTDNPHKEVVIEIDPDLPKQKIVFQYYEVITKFVRCDPLTLNDAFDKLETYHDKAYLLMLHLCFSTAYYWHNMSIDHFLIRHPEQALSTNFDKFHPIFFLSTVGFIFKLSVKDTNREMKRQFSEAALTLPDYMKKFVLTEPSPGVYDYLESILCNFPTLEELQDKNFDLNAYIDSARFDCVCEYYAIFDIPIRDILEWSRTS